MSITSELALNHANCLVKKDSFGVTKVYNICNETIQDIPWGILDWISAIVLFTFIFVLAAGFFGLGLFMYRETRR